MTAIATASGSRTPHIRIGNVDSEGEDTKGLKIAILKAWRPDALFSQIIYVQGTSESHRGVFKKRTHHYIVKTSEQPVKLGVSDQPWTTTQSERSPAVQ